MSFRGIWAEASTGCRNLVKCPKPSRIPGCPWLPSDVHGHHFMLICSHWYPLAFRVLAQLQRPRLSFLCSIWVAAGQGLFQMAVLWCDSKVDHTKRIIGPTPKAANFLGGVPNFEKKTYRVRVYTTLICVVRSPFGRAVRAVSLTGKSPGAGEGEDGGEGPEGLRDSRASAAQS